MENVKEKLEANKKFEKTHSPLVASKNLAFKNGTKGITLIALVITIIIMLILSAVTLMIVTNEGIFEKAEEARFKEELSRLQEELERFKLAKVSETQGEFEETTLSANKFWLYYEPVEYVANVSNNILSLILYICK